DDHRIGSEQPAVVDEAMVERALAAYLRRQEDGESLYGCVTAALTAALAQQPAAVTQPGAGEVSNGSGQPAAVDGVADFEIHAGGEYFASVGGPRERAWKEAMHYVSTLHPDDGEPEVFEVTRRKVALTAQQGGVK